MSIRPILALALAAVFSPAHATDDATVRAARYYAEGLERPLLQLRIGAQLVLACGRLRKACNEDQARLAADNRILTLLDALTLFPQRLDADPAAGITRAKELRQKIAATSETLLREAGDYDRKVFARFRATLVACPRDEGADAYLESLQALEVLNLVEFQGVPREDLSAAQRAIADETGREMGRWRQEPREHCVAARQLGEYLMQLMTSKLRPWSTPESTVDRQREFDFDKPRQAEPGDAQKAARSRELAHAVAGNFVSVYATELQLVAAPESAARIKEIAEQAGFPSEG